MRTVTLFLLGAVLHFSCGGKHEQHDVTNVKSDTFDVQKGNNSSWISDTITDAKAETQKFEVITFQNDPQIGGWGFDIYVDGKRYIHQPTVPVVAGVMGFGSKEQSETAGKMMVEKLRQCKMPPALDENDLETIGVKSTSLRLKDQ